MDDATTFEAQRPPFTALPNWVAGRLKHRELAILWLIESERPAAMPTVARLAQLTSLPTGAVRTALQGLEGKGVLEAMGLPAAAHFQP